VLDILKNSQRPMTSKEIQLTIKGKKNTTSAFREIKSLIKRDMITRIEVKLPKCQAIVFYQIKKGCV